MTDDRKEAITLTATALDKATRHLLNASMTGDDTALLLAYLGLRRATRLLETVCDSEGVLTSEAHEDAAADPLEGLRAMMEALKKMEADPTDPTEHTLYHVC
jgi:hypothetical protein